MRFPFRLLLCMTLVMTAAAPDAFGQTWAAPIYFSGTAAQSFGLTATPTAIGQTGRDRMNLDTDIHALRNIVAPSFHWSYDDYLQYVPVATAIGLKAAGYESRSSWGRMLTSSGLSVATVAVAVNGIKYSVGRLRPDGSAYNSFPSGHTATAFMSATILHKEYGWRSPWFSIGAYTTAAVTGMSRILNNRHWMGDVVAGAAIGIGSVHLGYFLSDLIFKDKGLCPSYAPPMFTYDPTKKHYTADLIFGRRFIIGAEGMKEMEQLPIRGGLTGISTDIPLIAGVGIKAQATASSMTYQSGSVSGLYSIMGGGFWNFHFARILELQCKAMLGWSWMDGAKGAGEVMTGAGEVVTGVGKVVTGFGKVATGTGLTAMGAGKEATDNGVTLGTGLSLSMITDSNFKVKAFADLESTNLSPARPWLNTLILGFGAGWFW